jgi:hypothetical protein
VGYVQRSYGRRSGVILKMKNSTPHIAPSLLVFRSSIATHSSFIVSGTLDNLSDAEKQFFRVIGIRRCYTKAGSDPRRLHTHGYCM